LIDNEALETDSTANKKIRRSPDFILVLTIYTWRRLGFLSRFYFTLDSICGTKLDVRRLIGLSRRLSNDIRNSTVNVLIKLDFFE
jgi:hypothetical protein